MGLNYPRKKVNKMWATLLAAMVLGSGGCHYGWKNSIREHYSFQSSQYYDCPHCGEVVSKAHFHECRCNGAPGCYGYQATCWRAWPQGCDKCPPPGAQQPCDVPSVPYALPVDATPVTVPSVAVPNITPPSVVVPNSVIAPPAQPEPIPQTSATPPATPAPSVETPTVETPTVPPPANVPQPSPPGLPTPTPGSSGQNILPQTPTVSAPTVPDFAAVAPSAASPPVNTPSITAPAPALPVQAIPEPPMFSNAAPPANVAQETSADLEKSPSATSNVPSVEPRVEITESQPRVAPPVLDRQPVEHIPQPQTETAHRDQPRKTIQPSFVQPSIVKPSMPTFIPAQPKPLVAKAPATTTTPAIVKAKPEKTQESVRTAQRSLEPTKATNAPGHPLKVESPKPQKSVLKPVQNLKPVVPAQLPTTPAPSAIITPSLKAAVPNSINNAPPRDAVAKKYVVEQGVIEQPTATEKKWAVVQPKAIAPPQQLPSTSLTPPTFSNTSLKMKVVEAPHLVPQSAPRLVPESPAQPLSVLPDEEPQLAPIVKPADLKPAKISGLQSARVDVVEPVRR